MTENGFVKAQSDNLPKIDVFMMTTYFASNPDFTSAEVKGVKAARSKRESYGDSAVGYVQVKRDGNICVVKGRITPEHNVRKKCYAVKAICDETEETILSVQCEDCAAHLGGATRIAMTQHHAIRGNMADVSAKDSAQETAVNFVASLTALLILSIFGNSLAIFLFMIFLHIVFNYFAVRAVCLRTLNEPRFLQVIDTYLKQEVIASPCEINRKEPIIFYHLGPNLLDLKLCGFQIKLGGSIKNFVMNSSKASVYQNVTQVYKDRLYIIIPNIQKRKMHVLIKEEATVDNMMCAYFHAVLLSIITCVINDYPTSYQKNADIRPFGQICVNLRSAEWTREKSERSDHVGGFSYEPSLELIKFVDNMVQKEWNRIRVGLLSTGWDLSKHLLMIDEWRVCKKLINLDPIQCDKIQFPSLLELVKILPFGDVINEIKAKESVSHMPFIIEPEQKIPSNLSLPVPTKSATDGVEENKMSKTSNVDKSVDVEHSNNKTGITLPKKYRLTRNENF